MMTEENQQTQEDRRAKWRDSDKVDGVKQGSEHRKMDITSTYDTENTDKSKHA